MAVVYVAGGCLWGVEAFFATIPGIIHTEAGRANGRSSKLDGPYDGYAECVKLHFDDRMLTITDIMNYLFEIIDPYSVNQQGNDIGQKYRTGLYSCVDDHLMKRVSSLNDVKTEIKLQWKSYRCLTTLKVLKNISNI